MMIIISIIINVQDELVAPKSKYTAPVYFYYYYSLPTLLLIAADDGK